MKYISELEKLSVQGKLRIIYNGLAYNYISIETDKLSSHRLVTLRDNDREETVMQEVFAKSDFSITIKDEKDEYHIKDFKLIELLHLAVAIQPGDHFSHYKTNTLYKVLFISESGNKEDKTKYITYTGPYGETYYTRTLEDFLGEVPSDSTGLVMSTEPTIPRFKKLF